MNKEIKARIIKSVSNYINKQNRQQKATGRKNQKPEKEVEKKVMWWLKKNGFSCHIVESKAVFNTKAKRYISGQTDKGMADIIGVTPDGIGCFIELKAPGKRYTLKNHQWDFLKSKIEKGCFAACVDGIESLEMHWNHFKTNRDLIKMLPKRKEPKGENFDSIYSS